MAYACLAGRPASLDALQRGEAPPSATATNSARYAPPRRTSAGDGRLVSFLPAAWSLAAWSTRASTAPCASRPAARKQRSRSPSAAAQKQGIVSRPSQPQLRPSRHGRSSQYCQRRQSVAKRQHAGARRGRRAVGKPQRGILRTRHPGQHQARYGKMRPLQVTEDDVPRLASPGFSPGPAGDRQRQQRRHRHRRFPAAHQRRCRRIRARRVQQHDHCRVLPHVIRSRHGIGMIHDDPSKAGDPKAKLDPAAPCG